MRTGNGDPARKGTAKNGKNEVNAEQSPGTPASGTRQTPRRFESKRPWAVRQASDPSWVEKIEPF